MGGVGTPSFHSQPHGNRWSMVSRRELKGQHSATDSLWVSHVACLSSPFLSLCSNSQLAASWGYEMFGSGQRNAAGGMESFILQRPCCAYQVMYLAQLSAKVLAGNSSSQNLLRKARACSYCYYLLQADAAWHLLSQQQYFDMTKLSDKQTTHTLQCFDLQRDMAGDAFPELLSGST